MVFSDDATLPPAVSPPPTPAPAAPTTTPAPSTSIPSPTAYPTPDAGTTESPTASPPAGDLQTVGPLPLASASGGSDLDMYYLKVRVCEGGRGGGGGGIARVSSCVARVYIDYISSRWREFPFSSFVLIVLERLSCA